MHQTHPFHKQLFNILSSVAIVFGVGACGSDSSIDSINFAGVDRILVNDETLSVGEATVVGVSFSFDREAVLDGNDNVVLVVHLPNGAAYRENTAELDTATSDDSIGARVTTCASGEQYLVFDMDDNDLDTARDPSGEGDARLKLTVNATAAVGFAAVEARARVNSALFSCDDPFLPDEIASIRIL